MVNNYCNIELFETINSQPNFSTNANDILIVDVLGIVDSDTTYTLLIK